MASKLYNVLNGINNGIEKCKENAKLAGFPVNEHTTLYTLAEMFKEINNVENMRTRYTYSWKRPDNWLDTETILRNAPEMNGMQPRYIMLFAEPMTSIVCEKYLNETDATKNSGVYSWGVEAVYTSDETWIDLTSAAVTHTWGEPINGFHYLIGYSTNELLPRFKSNKSSPYFLELTLGKCKPKQFSMNLAQFVSYRTIPDLINPSMQCTSVNGSMNYSVTKNIDLSGVVNLELYSSTAIGENIITFVDNAFALNTLKLPDVEAMNLIPGYNSSHSMFDIPYVYLPKLKTITSNGSYSVYIGNYSSDTMTHLFLDAPELETCTSVFLCLSGCYAPKLESISGKVSGIYVFGDGSCYHLPNLKAIGTGTASVSLLRLASCSQLVLPSLEVCDKINPIRTYLCSSLYAPKLYMLHTFDTTFNVTSSARYGYPSSTQYNGSMYYLDAPSLKKVSNLSTGTSSGLHLDNLNIPSIEEVVYGFNCLVDKDVVFPETLISLPDGCFKNCYGMITLTLPQNFVFSGLDLTNSTYLTVSSLRDIISKLADVSSDADNTYEITFGETNIAKLTTEEWQVAIDKGWVITDLVEEASE